MNSAFIILHSSFIYIVMTYKPRPRVLHLFSDWKWTGPAEPTVNLCRELTHRGYEVDLACARCPGTYPGSLEHMARERRVDPVLHFHLIPGFHPVRISRDVRALAEYMRREVVEIVHVHTSHDHYVGSRAAAKAGGVRVVRTNHRGVPLPRTFLSRRLICGHTHGWVSLSESALSEDLKNFSIPADKGIRVEGSIDLKRFPVGAQWPDVRPEFGFNKQHVIVGIVARVQKRRRFDLLLKAFAIAAKDVPRLRLLIVGRGTRIRELAGEPARELGIEREVAFAGYRGHDYPAVLAAMDFKVFLVPGSDGSCRAVREAMALGKPVIATRRGLLPELVEHERTGLLVDETPASLSEAILRLATDQALRTRLGQAASEKAEAKFSTAQHADRIEELYETVLGE